MSLAQIRYFVAVAEEGNVGRAAARLRIAQPPVSRQIRALEDEIGTPLFTRTPRGMELMPSGKAFLDHARGILDAVERAATALRANVLGKPSDPALAMPRRGNVGRQKVGDCRLHDLIAIAEWECHLVASFWRSGRRGRQAKKSSTQRKSVRQRDQREPFARPTVVAKWTAS